MQRKLWLGVIKSWILIKMSKRDGHFPESVSLRQISVGWLSSDTSDWIQHRFGCND
ncbi:AlpA family phage regulatory protein [Vibrio atlanticus]|uniref:AlpA family phage regulatory protein n=1 Tax=Vibrio atlanticus TaxID=693153 RepID=UPI000EFB0037|nr:AlpA family phage regulatory protein [Vibrio atlanticus]